MDIIEASSKINQHEKNWLVLAIAKHGTKFDYSKIQYKDSKTKLLIGCSIHGEFLTTSSRHIGTESGGCHWCDKESSLLKAYSSYKGKYPYVLNSLDPKKGSIRFRCKAHGDFIVEVTETTRFQSRRCPHCEEGPPRLTQEMFLTKAVQLWKNFYDYSKVVVRGTEYPVTIICPAHGEFSQKAYMHLKGSHGCSLCDPIVKTHEAFIQKASRKFANKFDYSLTSFVRTNVPITIICPAHGEFTWTPRKHLSSPHGCHHCGREGISKARAGTTDQFLLKAEKAHGNKFNYSQVEYKHQNEKVKIICPKHGMFEQLPGNHTLLEQGCPNCCPNISKPHKTLINFLVTLGLKEDEDFFVNDRKVLKDSGLELDLYFPKLSLAIEVNGVYWHSLDTLEQIKKKKYSHLTKLQLCESLGIRLLQITDTEIVKKQKLVFSLLQTTLGKAQKIGARNCYLKEVLPSEAGVFLEENHFQGKVGSTKRLGLFRKDDNTLVQLMTFAPSRYSKTVQWELVRACTKRGIVILGGFERIFKYFVKNFMKSEEVIGSYCDLRLFQGTLYPKLGFALVGRSEPNYKYLHRKGTFAGSRQKFQKHKLVKLLPNFDPKQTELQNMLAHNYRVLYDCGNDVYKYAKKS